MKKVRESLENFKYIDWVLALVLSVYSMRHVHWGLDMLDTGYSLINFQFMDLEHMDSMWYFSTYLSTFIGSLIMKLPFADTLLGLNFYTTLFIVALTTIAYFFCVRKLGMPKWIAFLGEFIALSLCWCPSSVVYNYFSYLMVLSCIILIYKGLVEEKKWCLFVAGICLGVNVLARFSNLTQAALILGVWAYGFLEYLERKEKGALQTTVNRTLWCIGGYLTGIVPLFGYIQIRYGVDEYIAGIARLFGMTETATDYAPSNMLLSVIFNYYINIYWVLKMLYYVFIGMVICVVAAQVCKRVSFVKENERLQKVINGLALAVVIGLSALMIYNFYVDGLCNVDFYAYDSVRDPSILFMMLTMVIVGIKCLRKDVTKADKLIGILIFLVVCMSSLGSNNGVYSSMNNLFLAAPYTLWNSCIFVKDAKDIVFKKLPIVLFPAKAMLIGFLLFYSVQVAMFGYTYFYVEAEGARNVVETVDNVPLLKGIKMNPQRAEEVSVAYEHLKENGTLGCESIVVGHRPSIAYYLQLPPAFNSWLSLRSFGMEQMIMNMDRVQEQMDSGEIKPPVIIAAKSYPDYDTDPKWALLLEFMEDNGYELTLDVGEFIFYEAVK